MKTFRIPLVGSVYHRNWADSDTLPAISTLDQRFVNVVFKLVQNPITGKSKVWAIKRPGLDTGTSITVSGGGTPTTPCYTAEMLPPNQSIGDLINHCIYKVDANTITLVVGNVSSSSATVTAHYTSSRILNFVDGSGNNCMAVHVLAETGSNSKGFYTTSPSVLTEISDADFPKSTMRGNFVYRDGYLFCITSSPARIHNSALNAPDSWSATGYVSLANPGSGMSLATYRDTIVAFSDRFIEFYRNVGNATGSPLERVRDTDITGYGIGKLGDAGGTGAIETHTDAGHRVFTARNTVFWINNSASDGGPGVFMLDGFQPKMISTPDVNFDLGRHPDEDLRINGIFELFGFTYLIITAGDQATDYAWVYCFELGVWVTWESSLFNTFVGVMNNTSANRTANIQDEILFISGTSIYKMDTTSLLSSDISYTDNGAAFTATIQTGVLDFETMKRKFLRRMDLVCSDPRAASTTGISWSDDDGQTWSTARNVDPNDGRAALHALGSFRRRQFRITNAANTPFEAESLEFEYEEGTH